MVRRVTDGTYIHGSPVDGIAEEFCDSFGGAFQRDGVSVRGHHTALHATVAALKPLSVRCKVNGTCWAAVFPHY